MLLITSTYVGPIKLTNLNIKNDFHFLHFFNWLLLDDLEAYTIGSETAKLDIHSVHILKDSI